MIDDILSRLDTADCRIHLASLVCDKQALQMRLNKDVAAGIRTEDIIRRSVERIPFYKSLNPYKVDVSKITPEQAAEFIIQNC